jgi:hypothetical protein
MHGDNIKVDRRKIGYEASSGRMVLALFNFSFLLTVVS